MPHKQVKTQFWENNVTTQTWVGSRLNCKIKIYLLVQFVHKTIILIDILKEGSSATRNQLKNVDIDYDLECAVNF